MASGIQVRGPHQFRVQIRRKGHYQTRTFESLREAQEWQRITDGKITGEEFVDLKAARSMTLAQACEWMLAGKRCGTNADAKNIAAKLRYWKESKFAAWALTAIHDWDLIEWRREVLDEDNAEEGHACGAQAQCGAQTVIHRLNALSKLIQTWARAHKVALENPVKAGVRPAKPRGRERRLNGDDEKRLLKAALGSSRPWLQSAIIIAIETGVRQSELAGLSWDRVKLGQPHPHIDLPKTKNDRPRRVPLSARAITAFKALKAQKEKGALLSERVLAVESARGIIHAFRDAISEEGFPDLRWHDLRHEAISRLFELTDLRDTEIMAITGHLTPAMLARYTHLRADRLGDRLPGGKLNPRKRSAA